MESTTFRARIMNYNPLSYKTTMYFECQTDFERWVKFSCITMSLFIVMYIHFSCNVNKWLSLNTVSLKIFDRVPVRSQSKISKQDLLTLALGSKEFVGVLQIDSNSIDYVAKFKIYYVAQMYMCLVDTLISCMRHSSMFSAVHELEGNV